MSDTTERTSRTTRGMSGTVIAMMTIPMPPPVSATIAIASRIEGIAINASITRMTIASTRRK